MTSATVEPSSGNRPSSYRKVSMATREAIRAAYESGVSIKEIRTRYDLPAATLRSMSEEWDRPVGKILPDPCVVVEKLNSQQLYAASGLELRHRQVGEEAVAFAHEMLGRLAAAMPEKIRLDGNFDRASRIAKNLMSVLKDAILIERAAYTQYGVVPSDTQVDQEFVTRLIVQLESRAKVLEHEGD